jgi:hypothetical protein
MKDTLIGVECAEEARLRNASKIYTDDYSMAGDVMLTNEQIQEKMMNYRGYVKCAHEGCTANVGSGRKDGAKSGVFCDSCYDKVMARENEYRAYKAQRAADTARYQEYSAQQSQWQAEAEKRRSEYVAPDYDDFSHINMFGYGTSQKEEDFDDIEVYGDGIVHRKSANSKFSNLYGYGARGDDTYIDIPKTTIGLSPKITIAATAKAVEQGHKIVQTFEMLNGIKKLRTVQPMGHNEREWVNTSSM